MRLRVIDLDGSITSQTGLLRRFSPEILDLSEWGPSLRLTCRFGAYRRFQQRLDELAGVNESPMLSFIGSGDFHHATLALLRRQPQPFNLLVIDKHPDWMRGIPVLHCGTWLHHALRLPNLRRVFHIGGDLDFDNYFRWLAPWSELRSGRITVMPAYRRYRKGGWTGVPHRPLVETGNSSSVTDVLEETLQSSLLDLARHPLYISFDKDVMSAAEAVVNWDSGTLAFDEVRDVLNWFHAASLGRLCGMDVVGDWSPVRMNWGLRSICHWIEHPALSVNSDAANRINRKINETLIEQVLGWSLRDSGSSRAAWERISAVS
jgi:hypothetical protein